MSENSSGNIRLTSTGKRHADNSNNKRCGFDLHHRVLCALVATCRKSRPARWQRNRHNLNTAKTLGLDVPITVQVTADEVIE